MKRVLVAVLLLPLAGCLADEPGPEDAPAPASGNQNDAWSSIDWAMTDCRYANAFIPVARDALAPFIPDGFEVVGGPGPLALEGVWEVRLGYELFACREGTGLNQSHAPLLHGGYFVSVRPPADLAVAGTDVHYLRLLNLINDDRLPLFAGLGFPLGPGAGAFMDGAEAPLVRVWAEIEGDGRVSYAVTGDELGPSSGDLFAEYMVGNGAAAVWQTNYTVHSLRLGDAVLQFPEGSLGAQIAGTLPLGVRAITGHWDFHDGSIAWGPWSHA